MITKDKQKASKAAVTITGLYLLALIASVLITLITASDTAMSGIFLVLVSMPWSLLLTRLLEILSFDSILFNTLFLMIGGLLNGLIIYKFISFLANRSKKS